MSLTEAETQELQVERDQIVGRWTDARQRLLRSPSSVIGLVLIGLFVFVAVFAPLLAPYEPGDQNLSIIRPGVYPGPSAEHLLGVDQLGRDILSRIIYGARTSLVIGLVSLGFGAVVGLTIGSLAGAFGGRVDTVLMRLMDMMLAIPGAMDASLDSFLIGQNGLLRLARHVRIAFPLGLHAGANRLLLGKDVRGPRRRICSLGLRRAARCCPSAKATTCWPRGPSASNGAASWSATSSPTRSPR